METKTRVMLDSGAFSAWTKGKVINLKEYIEFIKKNRAILDEYFNLDVIPGQKGQKVDTKEIERAADASFVNYQIMRKAGLKPIPVFHHGEDEKWLHKMLDAGADYIGIGGIVGRSTEIRRDWLDRVFTLLTDSFGKPIVKVHGLGMSSFELLRRYPWATCDATSWAMQAAYGAVLVPRFRNNVPDYSCDPHEITISVKGRDKGGVCVNHIQNLGPSIQKRVIDYLENVAGIDYDEAVESYMERARSIVFFMLQMQETLNDVRFVHRKHGFIQQYSGVRAT